jgi:hypothetical protein
MNRLPIWKKSGFIYKCAVGDFFKSHTTRPIPFLISEERLRIFFSSRDKNDIPYPTFIDVDPSDPQRILHVNESPMMKLGRMGTFDDSGVTPVSILSKGVEQPLMYYVGWKRRRYGVTIETSIGVAKLTNDYSSLERIFEGPILAQDRYHPILVAAPFVVSLPQGFRMWYCSGKEWREQSHGSEMLYTVYDAYSSDGLTWERFSIEPCIKYAHNSEVISAPWVVKLANGSMLMWYSTRGISNLNDKKYMVGLATSKDGNVWVRRDSKVGIKKSETGWDSEMICYPAIFNFSDKSYMLYSGNGVGMSGIGYAVADEQLDIVEW